MVRPDSPQAAKKRVFSGVAPSGTIHIGNLLGAIANWVQNQERYDNIFCVVDMHAITTPQNPQTLRAKIIEVANIYLAAGIDPQRSIIFIQSHVPAHAQLAWILDCVAGMGQLERMTQFKEKSALREEVSVGLFNYPALMAADILLYDTDLVPVGEDQKQHVELTRDLAQRFNSRFGETFVIPEPDIPPVGARVMGLDDPTKKMSKSAESAANYIALTDEPNVIRDKIKRAVSDSGAEIIFNEEDKPGISNLLTIHSLTSGRPIPELEQAYRGQGYAAFKRDVAEAVVAYLAPFQERYFELVRDAEGTRRILRDGAERAAAIADAKMRQVYERLGFVA
jgi:tryptophanyl-tRNA synthetase